MSRITGNDAKGLMEAYGAVYTPQELTEEQVWEEVENWVNSLIEEGYDLSEYTWDEMYEAYITEVVPLAIPAAMAAAPYVLPALGAAAYTAKELMNRRKTKNTPEQERFLNTGSFAASKESERRGKEAAELNRKQQGDTEKKDTPKPEEVAKLEARQKIKIKKPQVDLPKPPKENTAKDLGGEINLQNTPGQSSAPSSGNTGSAGQPPNKFIKNILQKMDKYNKTPAPQRPDIGTITRGVGTAALNAKNVLLGKDPVGFLGRTGGSYGADQLVTKGAGTEYLSQRVQSALQRTRAAGGEQKEKIKREGEAEREKFAAQQGQPPVGTPGQSPTVPAGMKIIIGPDGKNKVVPESFDLFDVVKGHLLDEGYADTEEAALVIMANMSEEWRESIVEGMFDFLPKTKTVISNKPEDKRNPLQKYSDATKPLFAGLPKTKTVIKK
jgi:hypothetical protein